MGILTRDLRFDGFSAPPAGAEHEVLTPRLTHSHHLAAGSQTAVLAGALGTALQPRNTKKTKKRRYYEVNQSSVKDTEIVNFLL